MADRELPTRLRGRIEASDIVQQALVKAWQAESQFQGNTHEQRLAWLRVIVKNTIRDQYRHTVQTQRRGAGAERLATEEYSADQTGLSQIPAYNSTASAQLVAAEESLALAAAMESLPEQQRQVIEMRHFDDLSHALIAERLGKTEPAVRMIWVRALRSLQQATAAAKNSSPNS